jgi:hypothetical protein
LLNLVNLVEAALWLLGTWLIFKEFGDLVRRIAQPLASPKGDPATQLGNSGATEGPPSVS